MSTRRLTKPGQDTAYNFATVKKSFEFHTNTVTQIPLNKLFVNQIYLKNHLFYHYESVDKMLQKAVE